MEEFGNFTVRSPGLGAQTRLFRRARDLASKALGAVCLGLLRLKAEVFARLPRRFQIGWGNAVGNLIRRAGFRAAVVKQNLEIAFPGSDASAQETRARLFRKSYQEFGNLVLELLLLFGPMKRFVQKNVVWTGYENIENALAKGKGLIFLGSHLGNWEVMAAAGGLRIPSPGLLGVTKQLKPKFLHQAIEKGRSQCGVQGTYEPRTLKDILSHLKKNGAIGFVLDQYAGPPVGVRVPVFGIPVGTPLALAAIAKRTGAAILPAENYRCEDGRWALNIYPPLEWQEDPDSSRELALNTAYYAQIVEKMILRHPAQWLWTHRRFKGDLGPLTPEEWLVRRRS